MKILVLALSLCVCGTLAAKQPKHLLMAGCNFKQVVEVDIATNQLTWSYDLKQKDDCNDVELTKEGNILMAYQGGARLVNRKGETLWDYPVKKGEELFTATQLPNRSYLLGICGHPDRVVYLNKKGEQTKELTFSLDVKSVHGHFRQILPTKRSTLLVPVMGEGRVIEMDGEGKIIREVKCSGNPFSVKELKNGHWLVSCGDAHCWEVIDPSTGKVVEKIADKVDDVSLLFVSEIIPLNKGRKIITNWNGHAKGSTQPAVFILNRENKREWTLPRALNIEKISACFLH